MKKSKVIKIGLLFCCVMIGAVVFNHHFNEPTEVKHFEEQFKKTGLINGIGKVLYEKGYLFSLNWNVSAKRKVDLVIQLPKEEMSEEVKNEVKQAVNGFLIESNVDPRLFRIDVASDPKLENICEPG